MGLIQGQDHGLDRADDRTDGHERTLPVLPVIARICGIATIITHHPQGPFRDDLVKGNRRGKLPLGDIGLINGHAIDGDPPRLNRIGDTVAADPDDAFDQGLFIACGDDPEELSDAPHRRRTMRRAQPAEFIMENDDVPALNRTRPGVDLFRSVLSCLFLRRSRRCLSRIR